MVVSSKPCLRAVSAESSRDDESTTFTRTVCRLAVCARARACAASAHSSPPLYTGTTTSTFRLGGAGSSGLVIEEALVDRHADDLEVEPQRPVVDVPKVVLHPLFHFLQCVGFAAQAVHL